MSTENNKGSALEGITKSQDLYLNNKNNNFEFINSLYREGKLRFDNHGEMWCNLADKEDNNYISEYTTQATENSFTHLRSIIKTLQEVYPDSWNLELIYNEKHKCVTLVGFSIHFPKMNITNNTGATHVLRDTYALTPLKLSGNFLQPNGLFTARLTCTQAEQTSGYWHSHISGSGTSRFQDFETTRGGNFLRNTYLNMCLGDSSQGITAAQRLFRRDPNTDNFISCLLHIKSTLRYESLEGGPHKRFQEIGSRNATNSGPINFSRNVGSTKVDQMGNLLLKVALKDDPNLLLKFDLKYHPFLNKSLTFQDDLKLKEIIDSSFRKLVALTPNPDSKIVLEQRSTGQSINYSLNELSKLFYYKDNFGLKHVETRRFFIEEESTATNTTDRVVRTFKSPFMFRGNLITAKEVIPAGTDNGISNTKLHASDPNIVLEESYFQQIKQTFIQKLIKNVFIQQKEVTEA